MWESLRMSRAWDRETQRERESERAGWKREGILMECDNAHKEGKKGAKLVVDK